MSVAAPVLHGVSAIFSFITVFLPKGESPELKAIKEGFKDMRRRFDQLDAKLDDIGKRVEELFEEAAIHTEFVTVIVNYKDKRAQLRTFLRLQKTLIDEGTNKSMKNFLTECGNDKPMSLFE